MTSQRDLITGLPMDVPGALVHLLRWLADNEAPTIDAPSPGIDTLVQILHESKMSVRRAIDFGIAAGILTVEEIYNCAGNKVRVSRHTKQEVPVKGKRVGRLIFPNWSRITQLQKVSVSIWNTLPESLGVHIEHTASVSTRGTGEERKDGVLNVSSRAEELSPAVCILAWRELEKRFREAQDLRGIPAHRQTSITHGKRDNHTLRQLILRMPAKHIWVPYMRVVNLFSFWIEHHPLRNLKTAMGAFLGNHKEWLQSLNEWETTAVTEFRVLAKSKVEETPEPAKAEMVAWGGDYGGDEMVPIEEAASEVVGAIYDRSHVSLPAKIIVPALRFSKSFDELMDIVNWYLNKYVGPPAAIPGREDWDFSDTLADDASFKRYMKSFFVDEVFKHAQREYLAEKESSAVEKMKRCGEVQKS